ncbi:MAG: twitching motility protein [Chthoniobacterales bacterium]|nr:MAG: twitching motility protein [Chthoniobacterales bacterium]
MDRQFLDSLLAGMLASAEGVSDLLFLAGRPPLIEADGQLREFQIDTPTKALVPAHIKELAILVINGDAKLEADFAKFGSCDCSYAVENLARFRVNIFKQNGRHAIVMRKLAATIPTLEKLSLPPIFREIPKEKNGIVLLTGGTGTGKTTTLAAIINELNQTQGVHIVTLEDPMEFLHRHGKAAISQRELGKDFSDFANGLRAALRQAPKVILVGEIRDRETMEVAMTAAETGHLVFSSLHTINAGQTINRIIGMFGREEEPQIRQRLAETLRYVVSQRLVEAIGGGRLLVTEVMGSSMRTRETIVYGESENKTFQEIIEAGSTLGWHSFDQCLFAAFELNRIAEATALTFSSNKNRMRRNLDIALKKQSAEGPSGLRLNPIATKPASPIGGVVVPSP